MQKYVQNFEVYSTRLDALRLCEVFLASCACGPHPIRAAPYEEGTGGEPYSGTAQCTKCSKTRWTDLDRSLCGPRGQSARGSDFPTEPVRFQCLFDLLLLWFWSLDTWPNAAFFWEHQSIKYILKHLEVFVFWCFEARFSWTLYLWQLDRWGSSYLPDMMHPTCNDIQCNHVQPVPWSVEFFGISRVCKPLRSAQDFGIVYTCDVKLGGSAWDEDCCIADSRVAALSHFLWNELNIFFIVSIKKITPENQWCFWFASPQGVDTTSWDTTESRGNGWEFLIWPCRYFFAVFMHMTKYINDS